MNLESESSQRTGLCYSDEEMISTHFSFISVTKKKNKKNKQQVEEENMKSAAAEPRKDPLR